MIRIDKWYLAVESADMRCGMDVLLAKVIEVFGQADAHTAYAFANARATRMKVLVHDGFGLWLSMRRLHQGRLFWPLQPSTSVQLTADQWQALTLGLPWQRLSNMSLKAA